MTLLFNLPGEWPNPWTMLRMVEVVGNPWRGVEGGFGNLETGEFVQLAWGGAVAGLGEHFAVGTDPTRVPMPDDLIADIENHLGILQVQAEVDADNPVQSTLAALHAVDAVIDGGALAVQVGCSGLAHDADTFQGLLRFVDTASDDQARDRALYALLVRHQVGVQPMTFGMRALGRPDVVLSSSRGVDHDIGTLERLAFVEHAASDVRVDDRQMPMGVNPYGIVLI